MRLSTNSWKKSTVKDSLGITFAGPTACEKLGISRSLLTLLYSKSFRLTLLGLPLLLS